MNLENEHEKRENSVNQPLGLFLDEECDEDVLQLFLAANPELKRETLDDFFVKTGLKRGKRKNGEVVEYHCLVFPLFGMNGDIVNRIVFPAEKPLTDQTPVILENQKLPGIFGSKAIFNYLCNENSPLKQTLFCEEASEVLALAGTIQKEDAERLTVFSMFGPNGKICSKEDLGTHDEDGNWGDYNPNATAIALIGLFDKEKILLQFFEQPNEDRKESCLLFIIAKWSLCRPPEKFALPLSSQSISVKEYVHSGGTLDGVLFWKSLNDHINPPPPPKDEYEEMFQQHSPPVAKIHLYSVPARYTCRNWMKSFGCEEGIFRYACADDGSLLRQLDPEPGTLTIIGGETRVGKTALISGIVYESMYRSEDAIDSILIVNTDQDEEILMQREYSRLTGITLDEMRCRTFFHNPNHQRQMTEVMPKIRMLNDKVYYYTGSPLYMENIEQDVNALKPDILVIDHLHAIQFRGDKKQAKDQDRMSRLVPFVNALARRGIAVICMSAFSRQGSRIAQRTSPDISALRDSSALEYGATKIWFLRQLRSAKNGYTHILEGKKDKESLQIDIPLIFDGARMQFRVADSIKPNVSRKPMKQSPKKPKIPSRNKTDTHGGLFAQ